MAFLCVFIAGMPRYMLGGYAGSRLNPLRSGMLCLGVFVSNTVAVVFTMRGPEDWGVIYAFAAVWWGVCLA